MPRPPKYPKLLHVKYVQAKGNVYAYFNTGKTKANGNTIYVRLPHPSTTGFFDSYAAMKGARTKREAIGYLVADLVRDYEASMEKRADLAEGTKSLYRLTNKRVVELLGEYPVNDLQPSDVRFMLENRMPGAGAHNIFLSLIRNLYSWGRQNEKTTLDPAKDMKPLKIGEHDPWPEPILFAGLRAEDDLLRLAIHLLYFTGQRISDVMKMRWSDILDGEIHVIQQKTNKEVTPPLHRDLAAELARTPKRGFTIIATERGQPVKAAFLRARIKEFTKAQGKECVPHGLRKNAVIALLEAGCTVAEVSAITGQTFQIVEKYASKVNRRRLGKAAILKFENASGTGKPLGKLSEEPR